MKNRIILILLVVSLLLNFLGLGLGLTFLSYKDLSVSYAVSRVPHIIGSAFTSDEPVVEPVDKPVDEPVDEPAEDSLKEIILQECPELNRPDITDYEKVSILRHWAASVIDTSTSSLLLDRRIPNFYLVSAYDMYKLFINDEGGVFCGGSSVFLGKVYELFGFETHILNYGTEDAVTHVVTLVFIEYNNQCVLSVQDGTFDLIYEHLNGDPMDYFTMLEFLREGRGDEISVVEPQIPLSRDYEKEVWNKETGDYRIIKTQTPMTIEATLNLDKINNFLVQRGLPPDIIYLYLFPISISPDPQHTLLDRARSISRWPIQFGIEVSP